MLWLVFFQQQQQQRRRHRLWVADSLYVYSFNSSNLNDFGGQGVYTSFPTTATQRIDGVAWDEDRGLAYLVSYYSTALLVMDAANAQQVITTFNFTDVVNPSGKVGPH